jgi:acetyl-CoA synthetase
MAAMTFPTLPDFAAARQGFALAVPEYYNFGFDLIDARATRADKLAYIAVDAASGRVERRRFSDLSRASNRFANVLRGLGVAKGAFAFVMIPRVPAWYEVLIGCIKLGVVAMPGTNLLQPKDIAYRLNKSRAAVAIVMAEHAPKVEAVRDQCPHLKHLIVVGAARPGWVHYEAAIAAAPDTLDRGSMSATRADETMLAFFTSGTTAFPKMVPREHSYALAHAMTARWWQDLRETDVHWTLSDTGWAKAAWGMLFGQWQIGAANVLYNAAPGFDADAHLKLVAALGVTTFCAPPTIYRTFAQLDLKQYDLASLRHCFSAGEPLNPEVIKVWRDATGTTVHDGYGQTETICVVANVPGMKIKPGSMGLPTPGIDVNVIDDDGRVRATGEIGHIGIRLAAPWPPGLFRGYFEDLEANAKCFRHGWYYTGDTAYRDEDGYLWFVGRSDDIIGSAAYRISPFEVESALLEHPAVAESAVVGKKDAMRGEIVKAYVVLAKGHAPSDALAKELQDFVKSVTAPYKYPREIEFRAALPKTISGKIRRVDLRAEANRGA